LILKYNNSGQHLLNSFYLWKTNEDTTDSRANSYMSIFYMTLSRGLPSIFLFSK